MCIKILPKYKLGLNDLLKIEGTDVGFIRYCGRLISR